MTRTSNSLKFNVNQYQNLGGTMQNHGKFQKKMRKRKKKLFN